MQSYIIKQSLAHNYLPKVCLALSLGRKMLILYTFWLVLMLAKFVFKQILVITKTLNVAPRKKCLLIYNVLFTFISHHI